MALRNLARLTALRRLTEISAAPRVFSSQTTEIQPRSVEYKYGPKKIKDIDLSKLTDFEISKDPIEWSYVEQALPWTTTVPKPQEFNGPAPSGWVPPRAEAKSLPYFIARTKNHMMPVYMHLSYRGMRRITLIRRIQGDICKLEEDLRKYLESKSTTGHKLIASRINEMCGQIKFRGDHVALVKQWMEIKGF